MIFLNLEDERRSATRTSISKGRKGPMLHFRKYLQNLTAVKTEFVSALKRFDFQAQQRSSGGFIRTLYCGDQRHHRNTVEVARFEY